jgi:hypothetical protein
MRNRAVYLKMLSYDKGKKKRIHTTIRPLNMMGLKRERKSVHTL